MLDISERATATTEVLHRSYDLDDISFRDDTDDDGWFRFDGVASVVDTPYSVRDRFGEFSETIRSGAFTKTLTDTKADVALFVNHQHAAPPLATRSTGRLKLTADPNLRVNAKLNGKRSDVQDTRHAVIDGELRQMSVGFTVPKDRDQWNDDFTERTITEVKLIEVSIVWRGANPHTTASMRFDDLMRSIHDVDMSDDELRRAIRSMERRFDDLFADDVRMMLRQALNKRYQPGPARYLWVRDHTDKVVVFELEGFTQSGTFRLGYSRSDSGIALDDDEPQAVAPVTNYVPTNGNRSDFAERDRADRERLERKTLIRV